MSTTNPSTSTTSTAATTPSNTSEPVSSTGTSNPGNNNGNGAGNSNDSRRNRGQFASRNNGGSSTFKGTILTIHTLATKAEKGGIEFVTFIKSLHQHAITAFLNPKDVAVAIMGFTDPLTYMVPKLPTRNSVRRKLGLYPGQLVANELAEGMK